MQIEVKKDALRQTQDGTWKLTLTVKPEDMPVELMTAPMGRIYYIDIKDAEEEEYNAEYTEPVLCKVEKSEGERLRIRAVIECDNEKFKSFAQQISEAKGAVFDYGFGEKDARWFICKLCGIESRSELVTNVEAQNKFKELLRLYDNWEYENRYK